MQELKEFRRYYNNHLHADLQAFDRQRWALIISIGLAILLALGLVLAVLAFELFPIIFLLILPYWFTYNFFLRWIERFKARFKPLVVQSILQFIDPRLRYYHKDFIPKDSFNRAHIFPFNPHIYSGEDYIMGKIGEVYFEMCELKVMHTSDVTDRLESWLNGVFFHTKFNFRAEGQMVIIPRVQAQKFIRTFKRLTRYGGYELKDTGNPRFDEDFLVYIDRKMKYEDILTPELLNTLNSYHERSGQEIYASFMGSHFYLAVAEPYELLDAHLFSTNVDFELISAYYEELFVFTQLVEDFDLRH